MAHLSHRTWAADICHQVRKVWTHSIAKLWQRTSSLILLFTRRYFNHTPEDGLMIDHNAVNTIVGPMWLFGVSALPLYIMQVLHIFRNSGNTGHILHCAVSSSRVGSYLKVVFCCFSLNQEKIVFINFFYTAGCVLTVSIGILYEVKGSRKFLAAMLPGKPEAMKMIFAGSLLSLICFVSQDMTYCG